MSPEPTKNSSRRAYITLFIAVFATMLGMGIIAPLLSIYADSLGASGLWVGIIFSSFALSRSVLMPFIGKISDRRGRKNILLLGLFAYGAISVGYLLAGSVYSLTVVRLIHGAASAMVVPIAMAYIGELSEKGKEVSHMGNFSISLFLGMGVGPVMGGLLNDTLGFASVFWVMAALSIFAALLILVLLPPVIRPGSGSVPAPATAQGAGLRMALQNPWMKAVGAFTFISALSRGSLMVFVPLYGPEIGLSPSEVGVVISLNIFLMALLQFPCGQLTDRGNKTALIVAGLLLTAVSIAAVPLSSTFLALLVVSALLGAGGALQQPPLMALTVEAGKEIGMGVSMGAYNSFMSIGMVVTPLMGGYFMDTLGIDAIFYLSGLITLIGTVFSYLMLRIWLRPKNGNLPPA